MTEMTRRSQDDSPPASRGLALITVLMMVSLLALVSITVSRGSGIQARIGDSITDGEKAYQTAQAGTEHALYLLVHDHGSLPHMPLDGSETTLIGQTPFGSGSYTASVSVDSAQGHMFVHATGWSGKAKRRLSRRIALYRDRFIEKDTYINLEAKSTNFGGLEYLEIGFIDWPYRGLVEVNLATLPIDAQVVMATLELYLYDRSAGSGTIDLDVHRVTRIWKAGTRLGSGNTNGANWKTATGGNKATDLWNTLGGDFDPTPVDTRTIDYSDGNGWISWDVTSLAHGWLTDPATNFGVLIKDTSETPAFRAIFYSGDHTDPALRPRLNIFYLRP